MMETVIVSVAVALLVAYMIGYVSFERGRVAASKEISEAMNDCVQWLTCLDASECGEWEEGYKTAVEDIRDAML